MIALACVCVCAWYGLRIGPCGVFREGEHEAARDESHGRGPSLNVSRLNSGAKRRCGSAASQDCAHVLANGGVAGGTGHVLQQVQASSSELAARCFAVLDHGVIYAD